MTGSIQIQDFREKITDPFTVFHRIFLNPIKLNSRGMSTCNRVVLENTRTSTDCARKSLMWRILMRDDDDDDDEDNT